MRFRTKLISASFICGLSIGALSGQLLSNAWGAITGVGYFIPDKSSVFTFKTTCMNSGSGEYWLNAEDQKNYYVSAGIGPVYAYLPKDKVLDEDRIFARENWHKRAMLRDNRIPGEETVYEIAPDTSIWPVDCAPY